MRRADLDAILHAALENRRLLTHPFYRRWEAGELSSKELTAYAEEYRHFEKLVPEILEGILTQVDEPVAKAAVEANLADERGVPAPHLSLFDSFADSVGAKVDQAPAPATARLLATYRDAVSAGAHQGLGALVAYEVQSSEIARSKENGLRVHYGLDADATRFWDVHGDMDVTHADWSCDALVRMTAADGGSEAAALAEDVRSAIEAAANAWWDFLDERESLAESLAAA